jgi:hypothetical protein
MALLATAFAGCASPAGHSEDRVVNDPPRTASPPAAAVAVPAETLDLALADAMKRTAQPREAIVVVTAEQVTWSDGSLGCPQPGMAYTQALVPGYRIVLRVGGQTLNYHAAMRGPPAYCPAGRAQPPGQGSDQAI